MNAADGESAFFLYRSKSEFHLLLLVTLFVHKNFTKITFDFHPKVVVI